MIANAPALTGPAETAPAARLSARVDGASGATFARLAAAEATASPFQGAGWITSYLDAHQAIDDFRLIEIGDEEGNALLLPLHILRCNGASLAVKVGGAHASFFVPLSIGDVSGWPSQALADALIMAGEQAGIDAFLLADGPLEWGGRPNPLVQMPHQSAPSSGAGLSLGADAEAVLARLMDRDDRKKQRYKRRKLAESGCLAAGWTPCDATLDAALACFFDWKAQQFAALGAPDPFAAPDIRAFIRHACCRPEPAIRLFVLTLDARPAAVIGVARSGGHVSGMFTAYDPTPAISRFSPGDIMMADFIQTLCTEGFSAFDLGVGEARYKAHFCPEPIPLVDIAVPVTTLGRITSAGWLMARRMKRVIKQNPAAFGLARKLRRAFAG